MHAEFDAPENASAIKLNKFDIPLITNVTPFFILLGRNFIIVPTHF